VSVLRTLFNFAKAAGYLPKGIATEADGLTTPKVQDAENIAVFTPREMQKLLTGSRAHTATATDEHRLWLALGGFAGLRTAELLRPEWSKHLQIERGLIQVSGDIAKTNGRRIITLQPNLMAWLASCAGRTGRVFAPRADERCHEYAKRMGVEWKANGLRHSFISYQCATTKNPPAVAMEAGNSVTVINKHYRELTTEAEGRVWFAIGRTRP
jgi:integrase